MRHVHPLLLAVICFPGLGPSSAQGGRPLGGAYPSAFFFRSCESVGPRIQGGRYTYEQWERTFGRLGGIIGKSLEEEVPGRSANIPYFTRFKKEHPDQVVLLHYNGNARDPRDAGDQFFAGHWIYFVGCKLTADLPREAGESDLQVADPTLFPTNMGRYKDKYVDLAICTLTEEGRPDWRVAEQLELVSVDAANKVLRVKRGAFGTEPLGFGAGKAYVAAHATEGPWGKRSNLLWYYNYSTKCPRDAKGRNCVDVLVDDFGDRFLPGGALAAYDGVEFDVMHHAYGNPRLDMDGDGKGDKGYFDGVNTYGLGVIEFCRRLREKWGDDRVIQADGANANSQRAMKWLNGIESEGWPHLSDWDIDDWSGGMNRHRYWQQFAREPKFNYVNHKYTTSGDQPGSRVKPEVPWSHHRVSLAACQFFDAAICYSFAPPKEADEGFGIWDELQRGVDRKPGWLGKPLDEAVWLARALPDTLKGEGTGAVERWSGADIETVKDGNAVKVTSTAPDADRLRFLLTGIPTNGPDLTVFVRMRAEPLKGYPEDVPRLAWVAIPPDAGLLVQPELPTSTGMCLRGEEEQPIDEATGAGVRYCPKRTLDGESHTAYLCHPPYGRQVGYMFWEREVAVPQDGKLEFFTGLSEKAEQRSDGVTYQVVATTDGRDYVTVFDQHVNEWRWQKHSVSLERWSGTRVTLRFITDCGPADNSTTDHSHWGDVKIVSASGEHRVTEPTRHMTFVGRDSFESTLYFRAVQTPTVDLAFDIEEAGAVWIECLTTHAHPEAIYREFENGLVLCNPAHHEFTFDLKQIAPGKRFRRIQAQSRQDMETNNGQPVGDQVTLGAVDAVFLAEVSQ